MGGLGRRRIIRLAVVGLTAAIVLLAACDGDETPTPTAATPSTETPAPTTSAAPAPATPTPTSAPPSPTTAPAETPSPTATPVTPSPTPVAIEPTPTPLPPSDSTGFELVVDIDQGAGSSLDLEAYPDATVSVNGYLVTLDTPGPSGFQNTLRGLAWPISVHSGDVRQVIATSLAGEQAQHNLAAPDSPLLYRHLTGVVVSTSDQNGGSGVLTIHGTQGHRVTARSVADLSSLRPGQLVTAVLTQHPGSDGWLVTGVEPAIDGFARLTAAIDAAQASGDLSAVERLRQRLLGVSTHHLTALVRAGLLQGEISQLRLSEELSEAHLAYSAVLSQAGGGRPTVQAEGMITVVDSQDRTVVLEQAGFSPAVVSFTSSSELWRIPHGLPAGAAENWLRQAGPASAYADQFGGREARFDQLEEAARVRVWYDLDTGNATRALVLPGATLPDEAAAALVSLARQGEAKGPVTAVSLDSDPPTVTIRDQFSGEHIELLVRSDNPLGGDSASAGLSSLPNILVAASYDPESRSLLVLDRLSISRVQQSVRGVLHSFIPKVLPGNVFILTVDDEIRAFSRTEATIITRDGQPVSITEVRIGDLVRPVTRYRVASDADASETAESPELVELSLRTPPPAPVQGAIRGIARLAGGGTSVTLSTGGLELLTLLVTGDTQLTMDGEPAGTDALTLGLRVAAGSFNPISLEAGQLELEDSP